jgi:hypothetical protein
MTLENTDLFLEATDLTLQEVLRIRPDPAFDLDADPDPTFH